MTGWRWVDAAIGWVTGNPEQFFLTCFGMVMLASGLEACAS